MLAPYLQLKHFFLLQTIAPREDDYSHLQRKLDPKLPLQKQSVSLVRGLLQSNIVLHLNILIHKLSPIGRSLAEPAGCDCRPPGKDFEGGTALASACPPRRKSVRGNERFEPDQGFTASGEAGNLVSHPSVLAASSRDGGD